MGDLSRYDATTGAVERIEDAEGKSIPACHIALGVGGRVVFSTPAGNGEMGLALWEPSAEHVARLPTDLLGYQQGSDAE